MNVRLASLPVMYHPHGAYLPEKDHNELVAEYHPKLVLTCLVRRGKRTRGPVWLSRVPALEPGEPRTPLSGFCLRVGHVCFVAFLWVNAVDPVKIRKYGE